MTNNLTDNFVVQIDLIKQVVFTSCWILSCHLIVCYISKVIIHINTANKFTPTSLVMQTLICYDDSHNMTHAGKSS